MTSVHRLGIDWWEKYRCWFLRKEKSKGGCQQWFLLVPIVEKLFRNSTQIFYQVGDEGSVTYGKVFVRERIYKFIAPVISLFFNSSDGEDEDVTLEFNEIIIVIIGGMINVVYWPSQEVVCSKSYFFLLSIAQETIWIGLSLPTLQWLLNTWQCSLCNWYLEYTTGLYSRL